MRYSRTRTASSLPMGCGCLAICARCVIARAAENESLGPETSTARGGRVPYKASAPVQITPSHRTIGVKLMKRAGCVMAGLTLQSKKEELRIGRRKPDHKSDASRFVRTKLKGFSENSPA